MVCPPSLKHVITLDRILYQKPPQREDFYLCSVFIRNRLSQTLKKAGRKLKSPMELPLLESAYPFNGMLILVTSRT